jgi:hypothetical protein
VNFIPSPYRSDFASRSAPLRPRSATSKPSRVRTIRFAEHHPQRIAPLPCDNSL